MNQTLTYKAYLSFEAPQENEENEHCLAESWGCPNIHTKPLRKEGEIKWSENSPILMKNINIHMEEPQLTLSKLNEKKFTLRHIIIELFEV